MISCENAKTSRVNLGSLRSDLVKALQDKEGWFEEAGHHGPVLLLLLVLYQQVLKLDLVAVHPEGLDGLKVGPVVDLDQQGVVLAGQLGGPGLVTSSILFRLLFTIKDQGENVHFQHTHNKVTYVLRHT